MIRLSLCIARMLAWTGVSHPNKQKSLTNNLNNKIARQKVSTKIMAFCSRFLNGNFAKKKAIARFLSFTSLICVFTLINVFLRPSGQTLSAISPTSRFNAESESSEMLLKTRKPWNFGNREESGFCHDILNNPKPYHKDCKRNLANMTCTAFQETLMFSQFKQDYYLYTRHFVRLERPGIYLDIGTNDPVSYSNTFFMDRCLGWSGLCVEANAEYTETIYRRRSCQLVPNCLSKKDGEHAMVGLYKGAGGIIGETYKNLQKFEDQNVTMQVVKQRCTTVETILDRNNVKTIDYMSLDVEGHELEVLKGVNWDKTIINVMTIEISSGNLEDISDFIIPKGYKRHYPDLDDEKSKKLGLLNEDVIFLHNSVEFGDPM